jgi:inner membrane protein
VPTVLAHAAVGASLAAGAPLAGDARLRIRLALAAALLAALPDADVVGFALGIPYGHPLGHRGLSHGLPFALVAGLAATPWVAPGGAWRTRRRAGVAAALVLATASHGLLDMATDAGRGVGLFVPFDMRRLFWPWRPIPTSPIGVEAFLRGRAGAILAFELRWLVAPCILAAVGLVRLRRRRARPARRAA